MTMAQALHRLSVIYEEIDTCQRPGYQYDHPLHDVDGYTSALESALSGISQAMTALRNAVPLDCISDPSHTSPQDRE